MCIVEPPFTTCDLETPFAVEQDLHVTLSDGTLTGYSN